MYEGDVLPACGRNHTPLSFAMLFVVVLCIFAEETVSCGSVTASETAGAAASDSETASEAVSGIAGETAGETAMSSNSILSPICT